MKKFVFLLLTALTLNGCRIVGVCVDQAWCDRDDKKPNKKSDKDVNTAEANDCKGSAFIGVWQSGVNKVEFTDKCRFSSTRCALLGNVTKNADNVGNTTLKITRVDRRLDQECPIAGSYDCKYDIDNPGIDMSIGCEDSKGKLIVSPFGDYTKVEPGAQSSAEGE